MVRRISLALLLMPVCSAGIAATFFSLDNNNSSQNWSGGTDVGYVDTTIYNCTSRTFTPSDESSDNFETVSGGTYCDEEDSFDAYTYDNCSRWYNDDFDESAKYKFTLTDEVNSNDYVTFKVYLTDPDDESCEHEKYGLEPDVGCPSGEVTASDGLSTYVTNKVDYTQQYGYQRYSENIYIFEPVVHYTALVTYPSVTNNPGMLKLFTQQVYQNIDQSQLATPTTISQPITIESTSPPELMLDVAASSVENAVYSTGKYWSSNYDYDVPTDCEDAYQQFLAGGLQQWSV